MTTPSASGVSCECRTLSTPRHRWWRVWRTASDGRHTGRPREASVRAASPRNDYRVLVDRVWPRGVSRQRAQLDEWHRNLAE
jgi:hypothetical protein